jgi:hypothetical protein
LINSCALARPAQARAKAAAKLTHLVKNRRGFIFFAGDNALRNYYSARKAKIGQLRDN